VLDQDYQAASRSGIEGLISFLERRRGGNLPLTGWTWMGSAED